MSCRLADAGGSFSVAMKVAGRMEAHSNDRMQTEVDIWKICCGWGSSPPLMECGER